MTCFEAAEEAKMNPDHVDTIIDACLYGNVARCWISEGEETGVSLT